MRRSAQTLQRDWTRFGRLWRFSPPKRAENTIFYGWAHWDSNPEPRDYESLALTVELWARTFIVRASARQGNALRITLPSPRRGRAGWAIGSAAPRDQSL